VWGRSGVGEGSGRISAVGYRKKYSKLITNVSHVKEALITLKNILKKQHDNLDHTLVNSILVVSSKTQNHAAVQRYNNNFRIKKQIYDRMDKTGIYL